MEHEAAPISREDEEKIWRWNATLPAAPERCIHDVFRDQARARPGAPAVDSFDGQLTYGRLDALSTRLAAALRRRGVEAGAGAVVPLCFDKSLWTVVAMLAVARAGAAFAVLDPAAPDARLRQVVAAVAARVAVVGAAQRARLEGLGLGLALVSDVEDVCRGEGEGEGQEEGEEEEEEEEEEMLREQVAVTPDDLAYVLFTSGSTGAPKVVLHGHREAVANSLHATGYGPGARVLQFAPQSFGASIWEIFKGLANGGCLVIPPARDRLGGIADFITRKRITRTFFTPSMLGLLRPEDVPCLRTLTVGGEPVPEPLVRAWCRRVRLIEAFGMTEGVAMETEIDRDGNRTRAGQRLVGATWLVDPDDVDRLAPVGAVGELCIESPALCRGYQDDPEANAQAFVESPRWARAAHHPPGRAARLFRTGDLARYVGDGVVQILGRKDSRVKLHGQRFELGEVERVVGGAVPEGVAVAADVVTPAGAATPLLVVFVHGAGPAHADALAVRRLAAAVRRRAAAALPDYMVPRGLVALAAMPVNASGKLDRRALREHARALTTAELVAPMRDAAGGEGEEEEEEEKKKEKTPPGSEGEVVLHAAWSQVLDLPPSSVGLEDDFFASGGTSLHCIKLLSAVRERGLRLEIEDVFESRTLGAMSRLLKPRRARAGTGLDDEDEDEDDDRAEGEEGAVASRYSVADLGLDIAEDRVEAVLEATDFQAWSVYAGLLQSRGWHDYLQFEFSGPLDEERMEQACRGLIATHAVLRTVFWVRARKTYQVVLKPEAYDLAFTVRSHDEATTTPSVQELAARAIEADMKEDIQLGDALVSCQMIRCRPADKTVVLMRISHAQYDAVSLDPIWRTLEALYHTGAAPAPDAVVPFSRVADATSPPARRRRAEAFWRRYLAGARMPAVLPRRAPRHDRALDGALAATAAPAGLGARGVTPAAAVLAAWALTLARLTGEADVTFGNIVSGRHVAVAGAEAAVGPCWNVVPVRVDTAAAAAGGSGAAALVGAVQAAYLRALAEGADLGHRRLVERCTSWPRWAAFSTVVNHLSLAAMEEPFSGAASRAAGLRCGFGIVEPANAGKECDLWLVSRPDAASGTVGLELRYPRGAGVPEAWARAVLDHFCLTLERLPSAFDEAGGGFEQPDLSLSVPPCFGVDEEEEEERKRQHVVRPSGSPATVPDGLVRDAWRFVLGDDLETREGPISDTTPFYEVWGDLIAASALARYYTEKGFKVRTEDMIDHPTIKAQETLLATRYIV